MDITTWDLVINYQYGDGVEVDMRKAKHYYELALASMTSQGKK